MRDLRFLGPKVRQHKLYPPSQYEGVFGMRSTVDGGDLRIIASSHLGWDHVSVSCRRRVPNWYEMEQVKRAFFEDTETAMQIHVPPAEHINNSEYCLHLWRPTDAAIPRPPGDMVGVLGQSVEDTKAMGHGVF